MSAFKTVAERRHWYTANRSPSGSGNISIYSDIGDWGIGASDFQRSLNSLGPVKRLTINISSNGGDVSAGFAIYNMLKRHAAYKTVVVDGLAASMASVIAMAGDEVHMPSNSLLMIHDPWGAAVGGPEEISSFGEALGKMRDAIADAYAAKTGLPRAELLEMMAQETWLSASEAHEKGFADKVIDAHQMAALIDCGKFKNTPLAIRAMTANRKPQSWDELRIRAWQKYNGQNP